MLKKEYNKDIIVRQVKEFIEINGKFPNQSDLQQQKGFAYGYSRIKDTFEGIPNLKRAVGWLDNESVQTTEDYLKYIESKGIRQDNGCLLWPNLTRNGYGAVSYKGKLWTLHRLVYELYHDKKIKEKNVIRHLCNNKMCYNIEHLKEGSQKENTEDMLKYSKRVKISQDQIRKVLVDWFTNETEIRNTYGGITAFDKRWAATLNMAKSSIYSIRTRGRWPEVYDSVLKELRGKSE